MKVRKMKDTPERKRFWEYVEKSAKEVRSWPKWMRGGENPRVPSIQPVITDTTGES